MIEILKQEKFSFLAAAALIVFQVINAAAMADDVDDFPIAPLNPQTREDCSNLRSRYAEKITEKYREMNRCMQSEATIGLGRLCNGGYGKQAWPECGDIEFNRCELERAQERTYKLCINAVNAKNQKKKNDIDYSSHEVYKLYEKGKELGENAKSLYDAIRNPGEYMKNILHDKFHELVIGNEMKGFSRDETLAHLYQFGYDYAKWGTGKTTDPVINDLQKHMLEKIGQAHKAMLSKIDEVDFEMENFIQELHAATQNSAPKPSDFKPTPVKSLGSSGSDSHQDCYLKKSSCEQSCGGDQACLGACEDEWYVCRYE